MHHFPFNLENIRKGCIRCRLSYEASHRYESPLFELPYKEGVWDPLAVVYSVHHSSRVIKDACRSAS